MFIRQPYQ